MSNKNIDPVKTYLRQRPFTEAERDSKCSNVVHKNGPREIFLHSSYSEKKYTVDHVFKDNASQAEVYDTVVAPLIGSVISGYNGTVLVYGQTGTGKTYTVLGDLPQHSGDVEDSSFGLVPRVSKQLFTELSKHSERTAYTIQISLIEIYNEEVRDLLNESVPLRVYDDPLNKGSVCLKGLRKITVFNTRDIFDWLRMTSENETKFHSRNPRSHIMFTFSVNVKEVNSVGEEINKSGRLNILDLAGSENAGRSGATDVRAKEAGTMNRSLITVGKVIRAVALKLQHVPYRESKLTRILQDSLGGNTITRMIATFSPNPHDFNETVATLDLAQCARGISNLPEINISKKQSSVDKEIQDEINRLKEELEISRRGEGFYLTAESYKKMTDDVKEKNDKLIQTLKQVRQLENHSKNLQAQYLKLKDSFEQTKHYFENTNKELYEKRSVVNKREQQLDAYIARYNEVTAVAESLLTVCEKSIKQEDIYHQKYQEKCSSTINNAQHSNELMNVFSDCGNKIANAIENYQQKSERFSDTATQSALFLQTTNSNDAAVHLSDLESGLQEMSNLTLDHEKLLKTESANYNQEHFEDFVSSIYQQSLAQLDNQTCIKKGLEELTENIATEMKQLDEESKGCLNLINSNSEENAKRTNALIGILEKIKSDFKAEEKDIEEQIKKEDERSSFYEKELAILLEEEKTIREKLLYQKSLKQQLRTLREQSKNKDFENITATVTSLLEVPKGVCSDIRDKVENIMSTIKDIKITFSEETSQCHDNITKYSTGMVDTAQANLRRHHSEVAKVSDECQDAIKKTKEALTIGLEHTCNMEESIVMIKESQAECESTVNKIIKESLDNARSLEQKVNFTGHMGDTPVKVTYEYPKQISCISRKLSEEMNGYREESSNA